MKKIIFIISFVTANAFASGYNYNEPEAKFQSKVRANRLDEKNAINNAMMFLAKGRCESKQILITKLVKLIEEKTYNADHIKKEGQIIKYVYTLDDDQEQVVVKLNNDDGEVRGIYLFKDDSDGGDILNECN